MTDEEREREIERVGAEGGSLLLTPCEACKAHEQSWLGAIIEELSFLLREKLRENTSEDELSYPRICALVSRVIIPAIKDAGYIKPTPVNPGDSQYYMEEWARANGYIKPKGEK